MPAGYERSRARLPRDYGEDKGEYARPYGGGGGRNRILMRIAAGAVAVVAVVLVVIVVKNVFGSASAGGQPTDAGFVTDPPDTTDDAGVLPTDESEPTDDIASESPTDTAPTDTASADPTDSVDPDDTASSSPTETASSSPTSNGGALDVPDVEGKADVEEYLPLRKSASSSAEKLVEIPKDGTFTILAVSTVKTWLKVKYDDKTGYVLAKYVSIGDGGDKKVCTVTSNTVNVRDGAGKSNDIVGTLKSGDTVVVEETKSASDGKWYKITVGSTTGYVFADNCRLCQR